MPEAERVLVAGAGPVGLVVANALADHGVPVLGLEAEPTLPETLRGSTFDPPTLDLRERFEVTDRLLAMGLVAPVPIPIDASPALGLLVLAGGPEAPVKRPASRWVTAAIC